MHLISFIFLAVQSLNPSFGYSDVCVLNKLWDIDCMENILKN